jgi:prepilin-type processing-associated H-X9-DG protein
MAKSSRRGSSLLELAIVMFLVGMLGTFLLPAIQRAKEKSRAAHCAYNLRRIINGVIKYEHAQGTYPPGRLFPDWADAFGNIRSSYTNYGSIVATDKTGFYSVHIWILPYVRAGYIFDLIDFDIAQTKRMENPFNTNFEAYTQPMQLYLCPSDSNTGRGITENNYRYNFGGDTPGAGQRSVTSFSRDPRPTDVWHFGGNGAFTIGETGLRGQDFEDGLSKTVFFSERTKGDARQDPTVPTNTDMIRCPGANFDPGRSFEPVFQAAESYVPQLESFVHTAAGRWPEGSDFSNGWPFAGYDSTEYNHVAPPNWESIDCGVSFIADTPGEHAFVAARSEHPRSVNVAFGDGHVKTINDDIDLTVWRALGTRNGGEVASPSTRRGGNRW